MNSRTPKIPKQFIVVDDRVLEVDYGQFILVSDYDDLLRRYKKLIKFGHIKGIFDKPKREGYTYDRAM